MKDVRKDKRNRVVSEQKRNFNCNFTQKFINIGAEISRKNNLFLQKKSSCFENIFDITL
jgi:hypothetical protein